MEQAGKQKFSTCRLSGSCEGSFEWKVGGPLKRQLRRHMGNCVTIVCYMISIIKWATADVAVAGCTCNQNAYENKQQQQQRQQQQQEMSMIIGHLLNCRSLDKCLVYCDAPGQQPQHTQLQAYACGTCNTPELASVSSFHLSLIKINQALLICLTLPVLLFLFPSLCFPSSAPCSSLCSLSLSPFLLHLPFISINSPHH